MEASRRCCPAVARRRRRRWCPIAAGGRGRRDVGAGGTVAVGPSAAAGRGHAGAARRSGAGAALGRAAADEDPTSPDVLELAALVFGRARRLGGTERMLMELAYHTPDRASGLARGAAVWDPSGRPREACAQWLNAARWRDDPEDPSCARRSPAPAAIPAPATGRRFAATCSRARNPSAASAGRSAGRAGRHRRRRCRRERRRRRRSMSTANRKHDSRPQMWLTCASSCAD